MAETTDDGQVRDLQLAEDAGANLPGPPTLDPGRKPAPEHGFGADIAGAGQPSGRQRQ